MIEFTCLPFHALSLDQLYEVMALRQMVFAVEQNCPYLDADGKDQQCYHLLGCEISSGRIQAYARLMPKGLAYDDYVAIGRVVTAPGARGMGQGKQLMLECIRWMEKVFGHQPIKISAQSYLRRFYENLGFQVVGPEYLEDGIPHLPMVRP